MGCDARILLPSNVRVRDVASVIGVAVGFTPEQRKLQGGGYYTEVPGVEVKTTSVADMVSIQFDGRHVHYFFESETDVAGMKDCRMLMPKSTPFWCLVGHRLVDFFGGVVDYNDCDASDVDYKKRAKNNERNRPCDGDPWHNFQDRVAAVKPITLQELQNFEGDVGYRDDSYEYWFDAQGNMTRMLTARAQTVRLEEAA